MATAAPAMYFRCKVCDRGALVSKKVYRMSAPVVFIGFVLLIPSVLGMLFCFYMFVSVANVPMSADETTRTAGGLAGGLFLLVGVFFMVGGLLGWLLVMKKQVLQCNLCNAVVNAS